MKIYPRVFKTNCRTKMFLVPSKQHQNKDIYVRIQGMEHYTIPHSKLFRSDEEDRYPYYQMQKIKPNLYCYEIELPYEQRYDLRIQIDNEVVLDTSIFAVEEDLYVLNPYKGDTHMHTTASDGLLEPLPLACAYRKKGCDFISVTDHQQYRPSIVTKELLESRTKIFVAYPGEEIHNRAMGHLHIVGFGGNQSVNDVILGNMDGVEEEVHNIMKNNKYPPNVDPFVIAYRTWISQKIREFGGVAIMAHPYWDAYGEYNVQKEDIKYLIKLHTYDAIEFLSSSDEFKLEGNGNNLTAALLHDLLKEGYDIPYLGASDTHTIQKGRGQFGRNFSIIFSKDLKFENMKKAILNYQCVALYTYDKIYYQAYGSYRYVNYARYLMRHFYPDYIKLCVKHAKALQNGDDLTNIEKKIIEYKEQFFGRKL